MEEPNVYANRTYTEITDIRDQRKVDRIRAVIPDDVRSIIDIGCGNGLITNELARDFDVLGADINASKLEFVNAPHIQASCDQIPRPDHSFDLVFSSEMIEHLPDKLFLRTLEEFERLSRKYILITVPNNEPLHKLQVQCEKCHKRYHKNGHLQSFTKGSIKKLFPSWKIVKLEEFGKPVRGYKKWLADLKHTFTPPESWIPSHWVKTQGVPYHFCLHCGAKNHIRSRYHVLSFILDSFNTLISPKFPSHLLICLERKSIS